MPVTPTYPGIYIEEILSNSHTITAAPTSVTVFVGYTHPFKTQPQNYGAAVEIFSFTDYERAVRRPVRRRLACRRRGAGGLSVLPQRRRARLDRRAAAASSTTWSTRARDTDRQPPILTILGHARHRDRVHRPGAGRRQPPADRVDHNPRSTAGTSSRNDLADITITYGNRTETYRRVTLNPADARATRSRNASAPSTTPVSSLVTVAPSGALPDGVAQRRSAPPRSTPTCRPTPFTTYFPGDFSTGVRSRTGRSTRSRSSTCC